MFIIIIYIIIIFYVNLIFCINSYRKLETIIIFTSSLLSVVIFIFLFFRYFVFLFISREEVRSLCVTYMTNRWSNIRFQTFAENEALLNFITDTVVRLRKINQWNNSQNFFLHFCFFASQLLNFYDNWYS